MAGKNWLPCIIFPICSRIIILLDLTNLKLLNKFSSLVHLTAFPEKHGSLAFSVYVFKKIHQKIKSLNIFEIQPNA